MPRKILGECTDIGCWIGELPKGCELCMKGLKSVVFITGLCPEKCYYCPLSLARKNKDVIYVNEAKVSGIDDAVLEAIASRSEGVGITGGDPLVRLGRTVEFIKEFKSFFGNKFHIHLYTTGILLREEVMEKLINAGLDELRIHVTGSHSWEALNIARKYPADLGIENPVIPGSLNFLKQLILDAEKIGVKFVNLNELEISEGNFYSLKALGLEPKPGSVAVKGSEDTALKLMEWALRQDLSLTIHYCPAIYKDKYQFRRRMMLRGKATRLPYEDIEEGLVKWIEASRCNTRIKNMLIASELAYTNKSSIRANPKLVATLKKHCKTITYVEAYPTTPRRILNIM